MPLLEKGLSVMAKSMLPDSGVGESMDFFGFPISQISSFGIEIDSGDMNFTLIQQIFLGIFFCLI